MSGPEDIQRALAGVMKYQWRYLGFGESECIACGARKDAMAQVEEACSRRCAWAFAAATLRAVTLDQL